MGSRCSCTARNAAGVWAGNDARVSHVQDTLKCCSYPAVHGRAQNVDIFVPKFCYTFWHVMHGIRGEKREGWNCVEELYRYIHTMEPAVGYWMTRVLLMTGDKGPLSAGVSRWKYKYVTSVAAITVSTPYNELSTRRPAGSFTELTPDSSVV